MGLLNKINGPQDLKKLKRKDLTGLAKEIRAFVLETVARTGGHLAPSLGVVELILALEYVFDSSRDRIVYDVGHQTYVHKILTGRREVFSTLRQYGGLSGFPKREESVHDAFNTGHSSTSISAALGFALARERLGEDYRSVAVIGDGAMTGGEAFEALNQAGHLGINLLVVLNDNEMSIAHNVGALSSYLSRLRADPFYTKRKKELESIMKRIPSIGPSMVNAVERFKDSVKHLFVPGMLFEELGFTYLGPINGHNIQELIEVLNKASGMQGPILLHVLTQKGKGYPPAEQNPDVFHGVGAFNLHTGQVLKTPGPPTYTSIFSDTIVELAAGNNKIVAISAAMTGGTGLSQFAKKYPERFFDVGIAEQNAVTMAAAMALQGLRPVVALYSTFFQRAYDQTVLDVCLQQAPVVFAVDRSGIVGEDGPTHQGAFDISFLRHIPGMSVMAPKDEEELRHMLYTAFLHSVPVAIRYPRGRGIGVELTAGYQELPWGKGEVIARGKDVLLLAVGAMVYPALSVRKILEDYGVSSSVVNARFVKPLDEELVLSAVRKHSCIVTLEENVLAGGFGSAVLELLAARGIVHKTLNIGLPDQFIIQGKPDTVKETLGLTPAKIAEKIVFHFCLKGKAKSKAN